MESCAGMVRESAEQGREAAQVPARGRVRGMAGLFAVVSFHRHHKNRKSAILPRSLKSAIYGLVGGPAFWIGGSFFLVRSLVFVVVKLGAARVGF
jgi:hypothetical protein